jgi:hypothetical protein
MDGPRETCNSRNVTRELLTRPREAARVAIPACRPAAPTARHAKALALQRTVGNRATRMLLRQTATSAARPTITATESGRNDDEIVVRMSDGSWYRVTRTPDPAHPIVRRHGGARVGFDSDADRVWMKVSWCRGTRGEIRIGGNPQGAAKDLLKTIAQQIANGGGADNVATTLRDASIQPFANVDLASSGRWRITGGITLTVNRTGVTSGTGHVEVDTGPVEVGASGSAGGGQWQITVTGTWTPGRHAPEHRCEPDEIEIPYTYSCVHEHDVPEHTELRPRVFEVPEDDTHFMYFDYAKATIDHALSDPELDALRAQLLAGWEITSVRANTSPEGLRTPGRGRFEGNDALARERAQAAIDETRDTCEGCVSGAVTVAAPSELYSPPDVGGPGRTREVEGRELEQFVVERFLSDPAEARHRTPDVLARIAAARGRHAKAQIVYPFLRRVEMHLHHVRQETRDVPVLVAGGTQSGPRGTCPPNVLDEAQSLWRINRSLRGQ